MASLMWQRVEQAHCRLLGHRWADHWFHDGELAQRFTTCDRCRSVDPAPIEKTLMTTLPRPVVRPALIELGLTCATPTAG